MDMRLAWRQTKMMEFLGLLIISAVVVGFLFLFVYIVAFIVGAPQENKQKHMTVKEKEIEDKRIEEEQKRIKNNLECINVNENIMENECSLRFNDSTASKYKYFYDENCLVLIKFDYIRDTKINESLPDDAVLRIPYSAIKYYTQDGNLTYSPYTFSSGKDFSASGAIAGALIGGGVGAVIGSRKDAGKTETKLIKNDTRKFCLYYEEKNTVKYLSAFENDGDRFYAYLHKIIPEKDYKYIQSQAIIQAQNDAVQPDISNRLKQLNGLHNSGLITDEEYEQKRSELISAL